MATYIALMSFTDQGVRSIKETVARTEAAKRAAKEFGVSFTSIHWTQGAYDVICELEAKDEASMMAFGMSIASLGNVRSQTLRAYTADEVKAFVAKMP